MAVRAILLAVALIGALAGCASPAGPAAGPWAASVCATLATWRGAITDLNQQAAAAMSATTTPEQTRTNLLDLVAGARDATEAARAAVAAAGVPAVEGGEQVAHGFAQSLAKTRDAYAGAEADLRALPAQDETAFYDGVVDVLGRLSAEYERAGQDLQTLDSPQLRQAFDNTPECQ